MRVLTLLLWALCVHQAALCQQKNEFVIKGQLKGVPDGTKMVLITQEGDTLTTDIASGENFLFKGSLPLEGRFLFVRTDTAVSKISIGPILVVNKPMEVTGVLGEKTPTVKGSTFHEDYFAWRKHSEPLMNKIQEVWNELSLLSGKYLAGVNGKDPAKDSVQVQAFRKADSAGRRRFDSLKNLLAPMFLKWVSEHRESLAVTWDLKGYAKDPEMVDKMQEAYNLLSPAAKAGYYGVEALKNINGTIAQRKLQPGKIIPDFSLTTLDGKKVFVLELAAKHKYTLIDVWASWCKPCRESIPELKENFDRFSSLGFHILALSIDKKEQPWKKAVEEDNTPWTHVRDADKSAEAIFGFDAIPAYILIDQKGRMIALDMLTNVPAFGESLRDGKLKIQLEKLFNQ